MPLLVWVAATDEFLSVIAFSKTFKRKVFYPDYYYEKYAIFTENEPTLVGVPEIVPSDYAVNPSGRPVNLKVGKSKPLILNLSE